MNRTVEARIDAHVREDRTSENFGDVVYLSLDGTAGALRYAYVYVRTPFQKGSDVNVVSGVLRVWLRGSGWAGGPHTITARRITGTWKERTLKWGNKPTTVADAVEAVAVTGGADGQMVEIDVTASLQAVAAGGDFYGYRLEVNTAGTKRLHSTETDVEGEVGDRTKPLVPELEVTWNRKPTPPTDLRPSGGRAVAVTTPTYRWDYHSALGEDSQSHSQVRVASDAAMTNVLWDSGWEANELTERLHGGAAIAEGLVRYWQVRVRDEGGRESDWSDVATFTKAAKDALTLNNPPLSGIVNDLTPPISWAFAGTQTAYRVELEQTDGAGGWERIWSTGRKAGDAVDVTVPADLIRHRNLDYRVTVDVWDDVDREDGKERDFTRVQRTFVYQRSGSPADPTNLVAVSDGPAVVLTFDRAATPDFFAVTVDDEVVYGRLDPEELRVDANSYQYRFYGARPGGVRTIGVEAVVNSGGELEHSDPAEVDHDHQVLGYWIIHETTQTEVVMFSERAPEMAIGESSEVFTPVGSRTPVKITDSVRGYEGQIGGLLATYDGVTAKTWRNRFQKIVGQASRGRTRRVFLDYSFRVEILDAEVRPADGLIDGFDAALSYFQTDDFTFAAKV